MEDHEHIWGEVEVSMFTENPHRKCRVPFCKIITLDLDDPFDYEVDDWDDDFEEEFAGG